MSFRVTGLDHVNVTTPEELEQEVVGWYQGVLGLEQVPKPRGTRERGAWFGTGGAQVHVSVDPHNPPKTAHFALVLDDLDAALVRLRDEGCHVEQAAEVLGRSRCYVRDPAGNRIELLTYDDVSKGEA